MYVSGGLEVEMMMISKLNEMIVMINIKFPSLLFSGLAEPYMVFSE